jgi:hypothetical protein
MERFTPRKESNSLNIYIDSGSKLSQSQEEVIVSVKDKSDDFDEWNRKNSALIEALANDFENEDTIMCQVNDHIAQHNKTNSWKQQKDGFEIAEINQFSPNNYEAPSTPIKPSSSEKDKNWFQIRPFNLTTKVLEERVNQEPQRRNRFKDKRESEIYIQDQQKSDQKSLGMTDNDDLSLSASKEANLSTICKEKECPDLKENTNKSELNLSYEWSDYSISISPPQTNQEKEDKSERHSPDEEFEINENDLDENFNNNYDDEEEDEEDQRQNKHYWLKQSQYLSGITERTIEESLFAQSHDTVSQKFSDVNAKPLLTSKYSCSESIAKRDSMAFLYDKLKDQLEKTSDNSADNAQEYALSLSPFEFEGGKMKEIQRENRKHDEDGQGILTLDELIQNDKDTPAKDIHSQMSFSTLSNRKSENRSDNGVESYQKSRLRVSMPQKKENEEPNQNQDILDFSSIKKFEESSSTLRKDNSVPELYCSMPNRNHIEMSPEVNSKNKRSRNKIAKEGNYLSHK